MPPLIVVLVTVTLIAGIAFGLSFWLVGAGMGALLGLGGVATNPPGYYSDHPAKALFGALATVAAGALFGTVVIGGAAWLFAEVVAPLFF